MLCIAFLCEAAPKAVRRSSKARPAERGRSTEPKRTRNSKPAEGDKKEKEKRKRKEKEAAWKHDTSDGRADDSSSNDAMSPLSNSSDGEDGSEQEIGFDPAALSELSEAGDSVKSGDLGTMLCKSSSEDGTHNPR